jgi:hypothetical protein
MCIYIVFKDDDDDIHVLYIYNVHLQGFSKSLQHMFFPRQRHGSFRPDPPVGASSHHEIHTPGPIRPQRHPFPAPLAARAKEWRRLYHLPSGNLT